MDFTEEEMMADLRAADASGDEELAQHIASLIKERRAQSVASQVPPEAPPKGRLESVRDLWGGYFDRMGNALEKRGDKFSEATQRAVSGDQGTLSTALQYAGNVAGGIGDVLGETISTTIATGSDLADPEIRQGFNDLLKGAIGSEQAQRAINYYKSLSPETQANIDSMFNIGTIMSPFKVAKGGVLLPKGHVKKKEMLKSMFQPERTKQKIAGELKFGTEFTDKMVDDLMEVKGLSRIRTPESNIKVLNNHISKLEGKIQNALGKWESTNPNVTIRSANSIMNQVDDILKQPKIQNLGFKPEKLESIRDQIERQIKSISNNVENPNTLKGLLKIRREFDKTIQDPVFKKTLEGNESALAAIDQVSVELRRRVNQMVSNVVNDENILDLLSKQSSAYGAINNYSLRTGAEMAGENTIGLLERMISQHPMAAYAAARNANAAIPLAAITAAPSALNWGAHLGGETARMLGPLGTAGRFGAVYGSPEEEAMR
jgi:hypothetical protein